MPHTRSAKKHMRKSEALRIANRAVKRAIKTQIKKVVTAAEGNSLDDLKKEYREAAKKLDKAAAKRIVHPNLAARKKSQLARLVHKKATAAKAP
jgi:small subunit ribosomal protein S20